MKENIGLVLEGGAMRGIFTAGVIDALIDANVQIPNVYAVSAGAYAGMNYVTKQKGRVLQTVVEPLYDYKYLGAKTFFKKGTFFDMDYLFNVAMKEKVPFNFKSFKDFKGRFITSTTSVKTGKAIYYEDYEDEEEFYRILRAANSMPLIARMSYVKGELVVDGGMNDAIPIVKALEDGMEKLVVVLTRDPSYRKKRHPGIDQRLTNVVYFRHPRFLWMLSKRYKRYNHSLDVVRELEEEGKAFVFRTDGLFLKNNENDPDKLKTYHKIGYDAAMQRMDELKSFLAG